MPLIVFLLLPVALIIVMALPFWVRPAHAQENIAVSCEAISLECPDAVIAEILIEDHDIFQATDNLPSWFPYKTVNKLHMNTREGTIRANLLFKTGDRLDVEKVRETQRKLRALNYFRNERLSCTQIEPCKVRVNVSLTENWSLIPIVDFEGRGLGTAVTVGLSEQNLIGRGKVLSASFRNGAEEGTTIIEQQWTVSYFDPNILRSEYRLYGSFSGLESGEIVSAFAEKPFFSLWTPWSAKIYANHNRQDNYLYRVGTIAAQFNQSLDTYGADFGYAITRGPPVVNRVRAFYTYQSQRIEDFVDFRVPGAFDVVPPPEETYSYPGVGYRRLGIDYVLETRIDKFDREEFYNLANDFNVWLGYSARAFGGDNDDLVFSVSDIQGYAFRTGHFFLLDASAGGYVIGCTDPRNMVFRFNYNHYLRDTCLDFWWVRNTFHWVASYAYGINLDSDQLLGLGYTNGMRGYDYSAFDGNQLLHFGLEDRVFSSKELFGLVAFGVLLFADAGYVWEEGEPMDLAELRYDVGFGIRTAIPSATGGNIVRFDWGFPIGNGYDAFGDMIFTITVASYFG